MNDLAMHGHDLFGTPVRPGSKLYSRFIVPPFSILDATSGDWKDRKRLWMAVGLKSEAGRSAKAYQINDWLDKKDLAGAPANSDGTSIFDPVLCECCYRWFCPPGGQIVDPFAGGSVRGIVASACGRSYWGCDLRQEQIEANREQGKDILGNPPDWFLEGTRPEWVCGDSAKELLNAPAADLIFSCPPYGNLETYSDDPRDISGMDSQGFRRAYRDIIGKVCDKLKQDRFAIFVVGDYRNKNSGLLENLVGGTIACFKSCGLDLYNEVILSTAAASAAIRATKQFDASLKFTKVHQNMLVFVKGSWKEARKSIGKLYEGDKSADDGESE